MRKSRVVAVDVAGDGEDGGREGWEDRGDGRPRTRVGRARFTLDAIIHYTTIKLCNFLPHFPCDFFFRALSIQLQRLDKRKRCESMREKVMVA